MHSGAVTYPQGEYIVRHIRNGYYDDEQLISDGTTILKPLPPQIVG